MTYLYQWSISPEKVDIVCPNCHSKAIFQFAKSHPVELKKDVVYFQQSIIFDYKAVISSGKKQHYALFYPNLYSCKVIENLMLPEGYDIELWFDPRTAKGLFDSYLGAYSCQYCGVKRKYQLQWYNDAYYKTQIKGHCLWAFDRPSLIALRSYIASHDRNAFRYDYSMFLLHIPTIFETKKNRVLVVSQLDKLLKG